MKVSEFNLLECLHLKVLLYGVVSLVVKLRIVIPSSWVQFPYDTPKIIALLTQR